MAETILRTIPLDDFDIKRDRAGRTVTAYAAVFGQPTEIRDKHGHYHEEINRAAFNRTISHGISRVSVFYNHGYDLSGKQNGLLAVPFATPVDIRPDGKGLLTVSRYNDGDLADAILSAWDGGQIRGQSFSGKVHQTRELGQRDGIPHIERTELGLREYGPTPMPAYDGAGLVMIRSQDDLAELVRSMLTEITTGTPQASPVVQDGSPGTGLPIATTDPGESHSSRNARIARQRANALRAFDMGVTQTCHSGGPIT